VTAKRHADAHALRARGLLLREIAARLGVKVSAVAYWLRSPPPRARRHDDTIVKMRRAGKSTREIVAATGMSVSGVNEALHRLGVPPKKRTFGPAWLAKAKRMRARGATYAEIAEAVGVSTQRVAQVLTRAVDRASS
jgi:DNA-binding CsgD family transcriptional regulator